MPPPPTPSKADADAPLMEDSAVAESPTQPNVDTPAEATPSNAWVQQLELATGIDIDGDGLIGGVAPPQANVLEA